MFDHSAPGRALELINFRHPFYERLSPVYLGEYVTLEQGTGIVHSAPAYGVDDFISCRRYGMKDDQILAPVMGDGKYASSLPFFGGLDIWTANSRIVENACLGLLGLRVNLWRTQGCQTGDRGRRAKEKGSSIRNIVRAIIVNTHRLTS